MVLGGLVELEETQADLLVRICSGPSSTAEDLRASEALTVPAAWWKKLMLDSGGSASLFPPDGKKGGPGFRP